MVGQGDVAPSTGTIHGTACAHSTCIAIIHTATGTNSWRRRHGLRVDLVAGNNQHMPQTVALQTATAQMPSGACCALL